MNHFSVFEIRLVYRLVVCNIYGVKSDDPRCASHQIMIIVIKDAFAFIQVSLRGADDSGLRTASG
jgi:hypothetical protein